MGCPLRGRKPDPGANECLLFDAMKLKGGVQILFERWIAAKPRSG